MNDLIMLVAYVRMSRRAAVARALQDLAVAGWTESAVVGHGHAAGGHGVEHTRFEIVVNKAQADTCVNAIGSAAHTGTNGDGMILTLPILSIERLSDRSVGSAALGEG